ncbi:hypothetical protein [Paraburkholderia sp.]
MSLKKDTLFGVFRQSNVRPIAENNRADATPRDPRNSESTEKHAGKDP